MRIDPYFYEQPKKEFVEELKKPVHEKAPYNFGKGKLSSGLVNSDGIYILEKFPDGKGLLDTAYEDFEKFTEVTGIAGKRYPVIIKNDKSLEYEEHIIETKTDSVTVYAADTEGVRRAIVYLEGEMTKNEGAFLALGVVRRKAYIKDRITRGFFSPTNRPPLYGDELLDEIDYYPDEYLNRLAHSGTNGLWIYTSFKALIYSERFNEKKQDCEKRIDKLTKVVNKCKKYGVKVFIFAIEPHGLTGELKERNTDIVGETVFEGYSPICLRKPAAREYVVNTVKELFQRVPDLGGYIDITAGERYTSCPSLARFKECPRCGKYSRGENLALTASIIAEGIKKAGTGAKFISWTYGHRYWDYSDIAEYVEKSDEDVIFMQNFEDRGYNEQLGRERIAFDYWLSYKGPSELFSETAKVTQRLNKPLYAKMQVCCSHELATVPYIPVPGIIFDKYRSARELGVTGVMECWYFGNYPSIMSKCAGEMSFSEKLSDKRSFLIDFAARSYGKTVAQKLTAAWEKFEEGYVDYPTNIMFSYYGPMHDGVVWELPLIPRNNPLPRSWLLTDTPDGDRIGECLFSGHTLDEAITLACRISESWSCGVSSLPLPEEDEGRSIALTLNILFKSGLNALKYFRLRKDLGEEVGDASLILSEMKKIIEEEKKNSLSMIALTRLDNRIGYHSEAEGFKFFEKKLLDRIEKLDKVLTEEFPAVEKRIAEGKTPLGYYYAENEKAYPLDGKAISLDEKREVKVSLRSEGLLYEIKAVSGDTVQIGEELTLFEPETAIVITDLFDTEKTLHPESSHTYERGLRLDDGATSHQSVFGDMIKEKLSKYECETTVKDGFAYHKILSKIPPEKWNRKTAVKIRIVVADAYLSPSEDPVITLGKKAFSPDEFAFFVPVNRNM